MIAVKQLFLSSPLLAFALVCAVVGLLAQGAAFSVRQLVKAAASKILSGLLDSELSRKSPSAPMPKSCARY